jgi:hypothetical protein
MESEEMMAVPRSLMPLLIHLHEAKLNAQNEEQAWQSLDKDIHPYHRRQPLLNTGLIEARGRKHARQYRITNDGIQAVLEARMPVTHVPDNEEIASIRKSIRPYSNGNDHHEDKTPVNSKQPAGECQDCIYREVVELLAAKQPQVLELVKALETTRRIRKELSI